MPVGPVGEFGGGISGGGSGGAVNQIGQQVAFNSTSANYTATPASTTGYLLANTTSGTSPTITLPSDGFTYEVVFTGSLWKAGTANDLCAIGIGTSPTAMLAVATAAISATGSPLPPVIVPQIIAAGQVLNIYVLNATGTGASHIITVQANAAGAANSTSPSTLAAYRVA
jgi:hypothetical protein